MPRTPSAGGNTDQRHHGAARTLSAQLRDDREPLRGTAPAQTGRPHATLAPALMIFPVGNISGLYSTLPPLLNGQRVVLLERFNVAEWHDHLLRFRPAAGGLPPAAIQMVLDADIPRADLGCLRGSVRGRRLLIPQSTGPLRSAMACPSCCPTAPPSSEGR